MGGSGRNRNKRRKNPAVAPPLAAPPASSTAADSAPDQPEEDPAYELNREELQGDQGIIDLNICLSNHFKDAKVYAQDLEEKRNTIKGEDCMEKYTKKLVKSADDSLLWIIREIEATEIEIRRRGGKAMPRPPEIQTFITLVNRIV